jgi:predicted small lipoprotein YifL
MIPASASTPKLVYRSGPLYPGPVRVPGEIPARAHLGAAVALVLALVLGLALGLVACGPKATGPYDFPPGDDDAAHDSAGEGHLLADRAPKAEPDDAAPRDAIEADPADPAACARSAETAAAATARRRAGTIARDDLLTVLNAGPGRFLRGLRVQAVLEARRFRGWQVLSFWPCDPRYAAVDLAAGDVVTRVNGVALERPEHLQRVWDGLRDAPALVVDVERVGGGFRLEYAIGP